MRTGRTRWFVAGLLCVSLVLCASSSRAQENPGKKKSATYGESNKMRGAVLNLTESGKQFAVSGYFYVNLFAGMEPTPTNTHPIKGNYSPNTKKLRARIIFTSPDGIKSEFPLTGDYDPAKDEFKLEVDTRLMVPKDQLSFDQVQRNTGSLAKITSSWSGGDKLDLAPTEGSTTDGATGEDDHQVITKPASTLRVKIVATMSCNVEDPKADPSGGTLVKFNNKPVTTGDDGTTTIELSPGTYNVKTFAENTSAGSMIFRVSKGGDRGTKYPANTKEGDYSVTFSSSDKNPASNVPDYVLAFRMVYCAK